MQAQSPPLEPMAASSSAYLTSSLTVAAAAAAAAKSAAAALSAQSVLDALGIAFASIGSSRPLTQQQFNSMVRRTFNVCDAACGKSGSWMLSQTAFSF
jgi:hypothetical protein